MDDVYCLFAIGNIYEIGNFVSRDIDKAIHFYELSAQKNYIYAFPEIGRIYNEGKLVPRNLYKAFQSYSFSTLFNSKYEKDFDEIKRELGYGSNYIKFQELPNEYESMKNNIGNKIIQKMYSCFNFSYYKLPNNDDQDLFIYEDNLHLYLNDFKFLVYDIIYSPNNDNINNDAKVNVIICIEGRCIIVEGIKFITLNTILGKLTNKGMKIIKIPSKNQEDTEIAINQIKTEINNFQEKCNYKISNNKFVDDTISTILVFLIRRFFYPTNYFKDQTFFNFYDDKSNENEMKLSIKKLLNITNENAYDKISFVKNLLNINDKIINESQQENQIKEFQKEDFIILRNILINEKESFNLVIHCESLHIFMMKTINQIDEFKHEIDFCSEYHHRCLTPFYGFVKDKKKKEIIGFIYEYMCNGNLSTFLKSMPDKQNDNIFIMTSIIRIIEGIEYLHSNSLIHRDIKPTNIFIDHDYLPYISDYDTIRCLKKCDSSTPKTNDIGSLRYTSPEQDKGGDVSYSSDIYSFGLVLYFIFKKRNLFEYNLSRIIEEKKNIMVLPQIDSSSKIQEIFDKCIKYEQSERMKINEIKLNLIDNIQSFDFFEKCLMSSSSFDPFDLKSSLIYEIMLLFFSNSENRKESKNYFYETIYWFAFGSFHKLYYPTGNFLMHMGIIFEKINPNKANYLKAKEYYEQSANLNNSYAFVKLGDLYYFGKGVEQNYLKAKEYYESSANLDNLYAFVKLGDLYYFGRGVEQNYLKAKENYEFAAEKNNSEALDKLGDLYYFGKGVEQNYLKAKEYYESLANLDNSNAFIKLGDLYYFGRGVEQNYSKAKEYYELSAKKNNPYAFEKLGDFYYYDNGVEQDYLKAKKYYELASKKNNSGAFVKLGELYYYGDGVEQDYLKAKEYYELASKKNNSDAFAKLGNLYYYGKGVEKDYLKAKKYYESSASLDNSYAIIKLGNLYYYGNGVEQDYLEAKKYYELASKKNNSDAFVKLGDLYYYGYGVEQNYLKAKKYYELASKKNNSDAFEKLGNLYYYGKGVEQNYIKAKECYESAAHFNNFDAYVNLGNIYYNGKGVKQDFNKAKDCYEIAAKHDNLTAIINLGCIYRKGLGVTQDYFRSIYYYERAAQQNDSSALFNLGEFFYNGQGVTKNLPKAKNYYELSSKIGNCFALNKLGDMYFNGEGVKQDYSKAKSYYELSAEIGNFEALYKLGNIYYHGFGTKQDYKKAIKYYELSSEQNNPDALFFLGNFYSSNEISDINIPKSIDYYQRCIKIENGNIVIPYSKENKYTMTYQRNKYRARAKNDLGLIYLLTLNEKNKGTDYIKESAFDEYPFGQNNYGLLNQFYIKNIGNAEHLYDRSSKHNFALSEYNLGYIKERSGKIEESIKYYIRASDDEDHPLIFCDIEHNDIRLSISKTFIICFTNLKLVEHFFIKENYDKSKEYFVKSLSKLQLIRDDLVYQFQFPFNYDDAKNSFSYLKSFIINFPLFNLKKDLKLTEFRNINVENNNEANNKCNNVNEKQISEKEKKWK